MPLLAYGEGDLQPYWLLALLLITFINWIATQLKRRRAEKRGESFEFDPEVFAPYRDAQDRAADTLRKREAEAEAQSPPSARDEIRDFFTALTGQAPPPPKPAQRQAAPAPPAVPSATPPPRAPAAASPYQSAGAQESAYLERLKASNAEAKSRKAALTAADQEAAALYQRQFGSTSQARTKRARRRNTGITRLLREPGSLRAAIVLREVLGPPKALQSETDASTI